MANKRAGTSVQAQVHEYLLKHPGEELHAQDLATQWGVSREQVAAAVNRLAKTHLSGQIETLVRARVYRYRPQGNANAATNEPLFRTIGSAKDGSIILERDDGTLFRAIEL